MGGNNEEEHAAEDPVRPGHPSQAEGEDPQRAEHRDPDLEGHPSPADGGEEG